MTDRRFRALVAATLVLFGAMAAAGSTACGQTFFPCSFDAQFLPYGPDAARRYLAAIGADLWRYLWIVQPLDLVVPALTCLSLREAFRRWAPARWTRILGGAAVLFADDVVNLAAKKRVVFVDQTVFAKTVGAFGDPSPQFGIDVTNAHE